VATSAYDPTVPRILAFDVNETLLDLAALDPLFERAFGDTAVRPQWFAQTLQLVFVGVITGRGVDFTTAQHGALRMVAERLDTQLADAAADEIVGAMRTLPPHPDVAPALDRLRDGGLTLCSLTNSSLEVSRAQLEHAGIADRFEAILSADQVGRLKPAPEPYRLAADTFGAPIGDVRLIAAHAWDCAGAIAAGARAAFVTRPGMVLSPVGEQPDIVGNGLDEVASLILA
jgi:2-haloacid dehalogenase